MKTPHYKSWQPSGLLLSLILSFGLVQQLPAKGVVAGTPIKNVVSVTYFINDNTNETETETASAEFIVDEIINVDVISLDNPVVIVPTPATDRVLSFQVTNTGNGIEPYILNANALVPSDNFNPSTPKIWLENNGQPGLQSTDIPLSTVIDSANLTTDSSGNPLLRPDQSIIVYVSADIPAGLNKDDIGLVTLSATSNTAGIQTIKAGESISNSGDSGTDLVSLKDFGTESADGTYRVSPVQLNLLKTIISVADPYGGNTAISASEVTYQINIDVIGENGQLDDLMIQDPTPEHLTYVNGSMSLNGTPITDVSDTDIGDFNQTLNNAITLNFGDVVAPSSHVLTLRYKIN